jgi:hypothetical protein
MKFSLLIKGAALTALLTTSLAAAEATNARVEAPWKSQGMMMMTSMKTAKFMGSFEGILHVKNEGHEAINKLPMMCPSVQHIDLEKKTMTVEGDCLIGAKGEVIFASFECSGPLNGCKGKFSLKGGTGKFEGISGGSSLEAEAVAQGVLEDKSGLFAMKEAVGVLIMPDMTYKIPEKKK